MLGPFIVNVSVLGYFLLLTHLSIPSKFGPIICNIYYMYTDISILGIHRYTYYINTCILLVVA